MAWSSARGDRDHLPVGKFSVGSFLDRNHPEQAMPFTTMMVHVDVERDCEQRVQLALALADRFQLAAIKKRTDRTFRLGGGHRSHERCPKPIPLLNGDMLEEAES